MHNQLIKEKGKIVSLLSLCLSFLVFFWDPCLLYCRFCFCFLLVYPIDVLGATELEMLRICLDTGINIGEHSSLIHGGGL